MHTVKKADQRSHHERWAHLRFAVVGQLLAAPPPKGELRAELERLAARQWPHPITGLPVRFGVSTLERWFHKARRESRDPVGVLRRKIRTDVGVQESLSLAVRQALRAQYAGHMSWSVALHHMNLRALAEQKPELGPIPSYSTIRRFLKAQGLIKRRRLSARRTAHALHLAAHVLLGLGDGGTVQGSALLLVHLALGNLEAVELFLSLPEFVEGLVLGEDVLVH